MTVQKDWELSIEVARLRLEVGSLQSELEKLRQTLACVQDAAERGYPPPCL